MSDTITVTKRTETGSLRMKRLRQTGLVPAVMYGHGEGTVLLTAPAKEIFKVVEAGSAIVKLSGDATGSAQIKEVQWDALGDSVLHLDLARIDENEKVEVDVQLQLHGECPGEKDGGVVKLLQKQITILCPANLVPDQLLVEVGEVQLDETVSASSIVLPNGAELAGNPDDTILTCAKPSVKAEPEEDDAAPAAEGEGEAAPAAEGDA